MRTAKKLPAPKCTACAGNGQRLVRVGQRVVWVPCDVCGPRAA